jgi:long-subunit fatty acid transport protein
MKELLLILTILLGITSLQASNDFKSAGAAESALGNHSTTLVNIFSIYNNQAAAAFLEKPGIGVAYNSSFLPVNINDVTIVGAAPLKFGTIGGSVNYFGSSLHYEMKVGLAYAMKFGERFGLGVQLDYLQSKTKDLTGNHYATFEIGLFYRPVSNVSIGAHVYNPIKWEVDEYSGEILPIVFNLGVQYAPIEPLLILAEVEKDIILPFNFKLGLSYEVTDGLFVRGGFNTNPTLFTFGLGYVLKDALSIDIASNYHLDLGFNTSISLSFAFKGKDEE